MTEYPSEADLERIAKWEIKSQADIDALWAFCKELWYYPDRFVPKTSEGEDFWAGDANWYVSTGGWSGNEDVIESLQSNVMFWMLCWRVSRVGGHFGFHIGGVIG